MNWQSMQTRTSVRFPLAPAPLHAAELFIFIFIFSAFSHSLTTRHCPPAPANAERVELLKITERHAPTLLSSGLYELMSKNARLWRKMPDCKLQASLLVTSH